MVLLVVGRAEVVVVVVVVRRARRGRRVGEMSRSSIVVVGRAWGGSCWCAGEVSSGGVSE